jgi:hypothetical protein
VLNIQRLVQHRERINLFFFVLAADGTKGSPPSKELPSAQVLSALEKATFDHQ